MTESRKLCSLIFLDDILHSVILKDGGILPQTYIWYNTNKCHACVVVTAQLHSKEDGARDIAAQGVLNLAKQCSDPAAVEALVKLFFAVLNGKCSEPG